MKSFGLKKYLSCISQSWKSKPNIKAQIQALPLEIEVSAEQLIIVGLKA